MLARIRMLEWLQWNDFVEVTFLNLCTYYGEKGEYKWINQTLYG